MSVDELVTHARAHGIVFTQVDGSRRRWYRLSLRRHRRGGGVVVREWGRIPEPLPLLVLMGEPEPEQPHRPRQRGDRCPDDRALHRTLVGHVRRRLAHGYVARP